jgi:hypothetical protein
MFYEENFMGTTTNHHFHDLFLTAKNTYIWLKNLIFIFFIETQHWTFILACKSLLKSIREKEEVIFRIVDHDLL